MCSHERVKKRAQFGFSTNFIYPELHLFTFEMEVCPIEMYSSEACTQTVYRYTSSDTGMEFPSSPLSFCFVEQSNYIGKGMSYGSALPTEMNGKTCICKTHVHKLGLTAYLYFLPTAPYVC